MKKLDLHSEKFAPSGGLAAAGFLNQLGRPKLGMMTVLAREAVQNSWDARSGNNDQVDFSIDYKYLTVGQLRSLRRSLHQTPNRLSLASLLANTQVPVLVVSDYGTTGLNGPTRADHAAIDTHNNFVNFVRNAGSTTRDIGRGGTYGYGKSVFYHASSVGTICVYTKAIENDNSISSRFIICAAADDYHESDLTGRLTHYTGRHWWGVKDDSGDFVEPLVGTEADEMALAIGMPGRSHSQTGTSIMIVAPRFDDLKNTQTQVQAVLDELVGYAWPKLVTLQDGKPQMRFSGSFSGKPLVCIEPNKHPVLKHFVQAFKNLTDAPAPSLTASRVEYISSKSPARNVGKLSMVSFIELNTLSELNFAQIVNHVALMRKPGLVVKYQPGPTMMSGELKYAGVFLADASADDSFAKSEPPTHDDWRADYLDNRTDKIIVNASTRGISDRIKEFTQPPGVQTENKQYPSLVRLADSLAELIPAEEGTAPDELLEEVAISNQSKSKPTIFSFGIYSKAPDKDVFDSSRQRVGIRILSNDIRQHNSVRYIVAGLKVVHAANSVGTKVRVIARVVLDGEELEQDPPQGASIPVVEKWLNDLNKIISRKDTAIVELATTDLEIWVRVPEDAIVELSFRAEKIH